MDLGINPEKIIYRFHIEGMPLETFTEKYKAGYKWAYDFFKDEESKKIIIDRIKGYLLDKPLSHRDTNQQYLDVIPFTQDEVFVDAGFYNGDTTLAFIDKVNDKYKHIYAFEPDKENYNSGLKNTKHLKDVALLNKGIYNTNTTLSFKSGEAGISQIKENGNSFIHTTTLDYFFDKIKNKPSFIKMDIEGAEKQAIEGAKETIKNHLPKLAIAVYHQPADLYEITKQIHELNPHYNFKLGQYYGSISETILYAYPKKISFVGSFGGFGGIQRVSSQVANTLSKTFHVSYIDYRGDEFKYPLNQKRIKIHRIGTKKPQMQQGEQIKIKYEKEIEKLNDLLRGENIAIFCGSFCTALIPMVQTQGLKIIAWQQSTYEKYITDYTKNYKEKYLEGVTKADKLICLTPDDKIKYKSLNKNTLSINNPVAFKPNPQEAKKCRYKTLLYVGRSSVESKGLDTLIEAFKKLQPKAYRLNIVVDKITNELWEKIKGLQDIKIILGNNDQVLRKYYETSDIFISPSRWEGFGLVMLEAMAFGMPIIATPTTGAKYILEGGKYGLLTSDFSKEAIIYEIEKITLDEKMRTFYAQQSLKRVESFDIEKIIPVWEKVIGEL